MNWLDAAVGLIVTASVGVSVIRGAVRELLYLAGWVLAFLLSALYGPTVGEIMLPDLIGDPWVRALGGHVVTFLLVLIGTATTAGLLSRLVHGVGLGLADRALGGAYGAVRGLVVVTMLVVLAGLTRLPQTQEWRTSASAPVLESLVLALKPYLPQAFAKRINFPSPSVRAV
jgi:membrane protein required for colicin V production